MDERLEYLEEVIGEYERYVNTIGTLGVNAPMLLYYRDEIQEMLDELMAEGDLDLQCTWAQVVELDNQVRDRSQVLVDEVGHANFKQYQIINDPPRQHWWWYLNTVTRAPVPPVKFWEVWKKEVREQGQG